MLGLQASIDNSQHIIIDASGKTMNISGSIDLKLSIQGSNMKQNFKVLNSKSYNNVILGRDFMSKFPSVEFDFANGKVKLGTVWHQCVNVQREEITRVKDKVTIASRSESVVNVKCNQSVALLTMDFEPTQIFGMPGVYATRCRVIPNLQGVFQITMLNTTANPIVINNRKCIGKLHPVRETRQHQQTVLENELSSLFAKDLCLGTDLSPEQRQQLVSLITKYEGIFASNPKKPSLVKNMKHRIITDDALPVNKKPHRIPHAWNDEVDKQIKEMLDNGIIRPSSSPWNSPIILVKKKDNSTRFVCDFRGLNDVTKKDAYPLPHIRDVLDKMQGSQYWTTLDAASAYWSMPLEEADKEKTAFAVPRGKYEFNVTPYGLCNAGASYQRMMDVSLSGLPAERILAYMDDIVIFTKTFEEHLQSIETVFERMKESNIALKLSKCIFASHKVDFLGFELSNSGIRPQSRLTDAISKFEQPKTKKELKGFLGLAGFYRVFIRNFANIAQPLNDLTSDKKPFAWTNECTNAFNTLKRELSSDPVLRFPNLQQEFVVEVDASNYAVGGILSQKAEDDELHPVAYFSTALQQSQRNWSATTKEAFALIVAVRHWHVYLAGTHFTLMSDHNPLTHLRQQKDPRGKFARWITELEEFNYTIQYIPGKENIKADTLSRKSSPEEIQPNSSFEDKVYQFVETKNFQIQLKEEQMKDPIISRVIQCIHDGKPIATGRLKRVQHQLRIEKGILTKSGRPVLPPSLRTMVVAEYHNAAHFGIDKMYSLLKTRFYWPNMYNYIRQFTLGCETCQQTKCDTRPPKAPLIPMFIPSAPMQFISLDIAYVPKDMNGYQYILLIGDVFSKYIQAVPLKDQTAPTITEAFQRQWVYIHGTPHYLLTDQGSNVDGQTMSEICNTIGTEKRRSSAYHSQGNGFAERNIRSVKDVLRAVLLHRKLQQSKWRSLLPSLVFALNTSESKATGCIPYNVVFGRSAVLPQDVLFQQGNVDNYDLVSPKEYEKDTTSLLRDIFDHVITKLEISKEKMQRQYNTKLRFIDYGRGQKVWLKVKHYKTGEDRKLAPRRTGPWKVIQKLPNGVNFEIENANGEKKVVHHDRIVPMLENGFRNKPSVQVQVSPNSEGEDSDIDFSDSDSDASVYEPQEAEFENQAELEDQENEVHREVRPRRQRQARYLPDSIPWGSLKI